MIFITQSKIQNIETSKSGKKLKFLMSNQINCVFCKEPVIKVYMIHFLSPKSLQSSKRHLLCCVSTRFRPVFAFNRQGLQIITMTPVRSLPKKIIRLLTTQRCFSSLCLPGMYFFSHGHNQTLEKKQHKVHSSYACSGSAWTEKVWKKIGKLVSSTVSWCLQIPLTLIIQFLLMGSARQVLHNLLRYHSLLEIRKFRHIGGCEASII